MHNTTQDYTKIGYARVSTSHRDADSQCRVLLQYVERESIFVDSISGTSAAASRPGFNKMIKFIDAHPEVKELHIFELSRIGRNYVDALTTILNLESRGIRVVSHSEKEIFINELSDINMRRMMLNFMLSFAEMERGRIQERTKAGLQAAQARGVKLGKRAKEINLEEVQRMRDEGMTLKEISAELGIHENTLRRRIQGRVKAQDNLLCALV